MNKVKMLEHSLVLVWRMFVEWINFNFFKVLEFFLFISLYKYFV